MNEETKGNTNQSKLRTVKILFICNLIPLLPCVYVTFWTIASYHMEVYWIWTRGFLGFILPVTFLRCFYIPYIASTVLSVYYFIFLYKEKFPKKETILFIVLFIICVLGLLSVETVFRAAMSV